MRISLIQFHPAPGRVDDNFNCVERLIERAMLDEPDVIVLPELWSTGYYPQPLKEYADGDGLRTKEFLTKTARLNGINILGGTVIAGEGDRIFNRSYVVDRTGMLRAEYDKIHLFSMAGENKVFDAGARLVTFELDGVKCSIAVCYDIRFPEMIRRLALDGVELIFVPAAWPKKRLEHWRLMNKARAVENQIFIAAVNSGGHSMAIDPWGEILSEGEADDCILTVEIDRNRIEEVRSMMNLFADRNELIDRV